MNKCLVIYGQLRTELYCEAKVVELWYYSAISVNYNQSLRRIEKAVLD